MNKITKLDIDSAFKELNNIEIPAVKPLAEAYRNRAANKTDALIEDYYDVNNHEDLESAKEEREDEIAKAKLAKIEKIVDLDAETPEDIQPSYVGKTIIQCPQCMTLFYKDPADIVASDDNAEIVNVGEKCQHCGNEDGYTLIGKVEEVEPEEAVNFDTEAEGELPDADSTEELPEEPVDENELDLDFDLSDEEIPEEESREEMADDKKEESLKESVKSDIDNIVNNWNDAKTEGLEICPKCGKEICTCDEEISEEKDHTCCKSDDCKDAEELKEAINSDELSKKLKEHDEYIKVLQDEIKAEEDAVKNAKNDFIKKMHENNLESLKDALDKAIPEEVKAEAAIEDLPTAEDATEDMTKNEDIKEEKCPVCGDELDGKEPCEKCKKELEEAVTTELNESNCLTEDSEKLDDSDEAIDAMLDSKEFKTPVSEEEVEAIIGESCKKESTLEDLHTIENINDKCIEECITNSLTEVYENVDSFKLENCEMLDEELAIEGTINFKSGSARKTKYLFTEAKLTDKNLVLTGSNKMFGKDSSIILEGILEENNTMFITEKLSYKYTIGENLVEGLINRK